MYIYIYIYIYLSCVYVSICLMGQLQKPKTILTSNHVQPTRKWVEYLTLHLLKSDHNIAQTLLLNCFPSENRCVWTKNTLKSYRNHHFAHENTVALSAATIPIFSELLGFPRPSDINHGRLGHSRQQHFLGGYWRRLQPHDVPNIFCRKRT